MVIEVKVPLTEEELKQLLNMAQKKGGWEKLFGVAKGLPKFKEEDRVDVRI